MKQRNHYGILEYNDPTLDPEHTYWTVYCNGFAIATADSEADAQRKLKEYKKSLRRKR